VTCLFFALKITGLPVQEKRVEKFEGIIVAFGQQRSVVLRRTANKTNARGERREHHDATNGQTDEGRIPHTVWLAILKVADM